MNIFCSLNCRHDDITVSRDARPSTVAIKCTGQQGSATGMWWAAHSQDSCPPEALAGREVQRWVHSRHIRGSELASPVNRSEIESLVPNFRFTLLWI